MDTDVLIVGAGPTGLMLANQLARRGIRTLIVDRHAGPSQQTRALGVQARTLEIYAHLGLVERALELGKRATGANLWADGRKTARLPLGDAGRNLTPYPYILILGQDDNERIMGERLHAQGLPVQWNTELIALTQHADHASATLRNPDGTTREVSAAWVAGCDGAHSAVRELNGVAFDGAPYEHVFFVADVDVTGNMVAEEVNVYLWRQGFHLFFPMRGKDHWRIVGIVPPELRGKPDLGFDAVIPSVRGEAGSLAFKSCTWFSTYRIHHRSARHLRDRRCFLLGDAAHIHSPVGAQGMNTGLQDAYNLAWKLALVVQRRADAALLDSYEAERLPVARRLLATTDRAFRLIVSDSWWAGLLRTKVLARIGALVLSRERLQRLAFRTVSQIGIHYRGSALSAMGSPMPGEGPQAGDRFPWLRLRFDGNDASRANDVAQDLFERLDDTRFHLLVFGSTAPDFAALPIADMLDVSSVASTAANDAELARVGIPMPSFYLLRPDGHIGLCGAHIDAGSIARYVDERLRIASGS
jgi:2-polyprenyl-6-methoxyphenol hydroxylase-like FAD-dependent oxidoreductase